MSKKIFVYILKLKIAESKIGQKLITKKLKIKISRNV